MTYFSSEKNHAAIYTLTLKNKKIQGHASARPGGKMNLYHLHDYYKLLRDIVTHKKRDKGRPSWRIELIRSQKVKKSHAVRQGFDGFTEESFCG